MMKLFEDFFDDVDDEIITDNSSEEIDADIKGNHMMRFVIYSVIDCDYFKAQILRPVPFHAMFRKLLSMFDNLKSVDVNTNDIKMRLGFVNKNEIKSLSYTEFDFSTLNKVIDGSDLIKKDFLVNQMEDYVENMVQFWSQIGYAIEIKVPFQISKIHNPKVKTFIKEFAMLFNYMFKIENLMQLSKNIEDFDNIQRVYLYLYNDNKIVEDIRTNLIGLWQINHLGRLFEVIYNVKLEDSET